MIKTLYSFYRNFQLSVARKTLGRIEERSDMSLLEQRQAFSSLKAIRAGRRVGSVRTGHRVRDYYPGTVSQISGSMQNAKPNSKIQIYQVRHTYMHRHYMICDITRVCYKNRCNKACLLLTG